MCISRKYFHFTLRNYIHTLYFWKIWMFEMTINLSLMQSKYNLLLTKTKRNNFLIPVLPIFFATRTIIFENHDQMQIYNLCFIFFTNCRVETTLLRKICKILILLFKQERKTQWPPQYECTSDNLKYHRHAAVTRVLFEDKMFVDTETTNLLNSFRTMPVPPKG